MKKISKKTQTMMRLICVSITLLLTCCISIRCLASDQSKEWSGKIERPTSKIIVDDVMYYEISTPEQLAYISKTGEEWSGYNYILTNDIVLNSEFIVFDAEKKILVNGETLKKWDPIREFNGIFNGNNFSIYGVYVTTDSSAGFFDDLLGDVKNLTITNSYIEGNENVGGICGTFDNTGKTMTNCFFSGIVKGVSNVGGLIGHNHATDIVSSGNYGNVYGDGDNVAGVVGNFYAYGITDCFNEGNVYSNGNYVAGIANHSETYSISNCVNNGNIIGNKYVAGVCGAIADADILSCGNTGRIIGIQYVGGICGYSKHGYVESWMSSISASYNTGEIKAESYCGGISGYSTFSNINNCCSTGDVVGNTFVGAIIGNSESIWRKGKVENCYYLKDINTNTKNSGFGNCDDLDGVYKKTIEFFCISNDALNVNGHNFLVEKTIKEATCTETGENLVKCNCGRSYNEIIPAKGHKEVTVFGYAPTCGSNGATDGVYCSACKLIIAKQETIPATGEHEESVIYGYQSTCTNEGFTDGIYCNVCNKVLTEQKRIPARGHNIVVDLPAREATCRLFGNTKGYHCCDCDYLVPARYIAPTGHKEVSIPEIASSCTEPGFTSGVYCVYCDEILIMPEEIEPLGHTDSDNDGKCDTCGESLGTTPEETENPSENCSCACHKKGIVKFFFKIGLFFQRIFKKNKVCKCGARHY